MRKIPNKLIAKGSVTPSGANNIVLIYIPNEELLFPVWGYNIELVNGNPTPTQYPAAYFVIQSQTYSVPGQSETIYYYEYYYFTNAQTNPAKWRRSSRNVPITTLPIELAADTNTVAQGTIKIEDYLSLLSQISFIKAIDVGFQGLLFQKYKNILSLDSIQKSVLFYPKEIALREAAEREGKSRLEFINFWRTSLSYDWNRANTVAARSGINVPDPPLGYRIIKSIPAQIQYDVWFWTKDKEKLNLISEEYLFWQQTDPNLDLLYLETYPLELDLHFGELIDESTVLEKYDKGTIFVTRGSVTVEGWIFVSSGYKSNIIYKIHLLCVNDTGSLNYQEIIAHDGTQNTSLIQTLKLIERNITS